MLVVSDTTPLNYLALIGEIDLLPRLYSTVVVPSQVIRELEHARTPLVVREWVAQLPQWVEVRTANEGRFPSLDSGEAAALSLAIELKSPLLVDESKARAMARECGVPAIGTIGILAEGHIRGFVNFEEALEKLRETSFRIHPSVIQTFRSRLGEEGLR
jgi:predicted nucleic acid-binding protein